MTSADVRATKMQTMGRHGLRWALGLALLVPMFMAAAQLDEPDVLLYPLRSIVYEAAIDLTGVARPEEAILIELNGVEVARTRSNESGDFTVPITLQEGPNVLVLSMPDAQFATNSGAHPVTFVPSLEEAEEEPEPQLRKGPREEETMSAQADLIPPLLDAPPATTTANPINVSGTVADGADIRLFVNGRFLRSVRATNGTFSTWVPLEDGTNSIYATVRARLETSAASNTVQTVYTNNLPRAYVGTISQNTVWTKGNGTAYSLTGNLTVAPGATLWIQPGALVTVAGNYKLLAQGHLVVTGSATARASFKAAAAGCNGTARRSDWLGIEVPADGLAEIEYAEIQCAVAAVKYLAGTGSVRYSRIINNTNGIVTEGVNLSAVISPSITAENELNNNAAGVSANKNSNPSISGNNLFTSNSTAILVKGGGGTAQMQDPRPVINGNRILLSNTSGITAETFITGLPATVNARSNWWGTTDHNLIIGEVTDWHDVSNPENSSRPIVDFTGYLDAPNGAPFFTGSTMLGLITTNRVYSGNQVQTLGPVVVAAGASLSIGPGTQLMAAAGSKILVRGTISIAGSASAPAVLRPSTSACNGYDQGREDWVGIVVESGATATVDHAEIYCADIGVNFSGGTGEVHHSRLLTGGTGIQTQAASSARITPLITGDNEFFGNAYGIRVNVNSSPNISGGNQFQSNGSAISINGNNTASQNPLPSITKNIFHSSSDKQIEAHNFGAARTVRIDTTGNWWGTADPKQISDSIYDWTDLPASSPIVDYSGFLASATGTAAWSGLTLNGVISTTQTLGNAQHLMLGRVEVDTGVSLTVAGGARITPVGKFPFIAKGTLNVVGTQSSRVVFRPLTAACTNSAESRYDWDGLRYEPGSAGGVQFADIRCAEAGIQMSHNGAIKSNLLSGNYTGIFVRGGSATTWAAPTIQGNEVLNSNYGIHIEKFASPSINSGNLISANNVGIRIQGDFDFASMPSPVINGNGVFANTGKNLEALYFASQAQVQAVIVNARGNWWGTPDPTEIPPTIRDQKDLDESPYVDFSGYLGALGGAPVFPGTSLIGIVPANTTLGAGTYEVLGDYIVPSGRTLTLSPGADLRFVPGRALIVSGTLNAQGSPAQRVVFGSTARIPAKGDWFGVQTLQGGVMNIQHARIEHSTNGFMFSGGQGLVKESLSRFNKYGVFVEAKSSPTISPNNEITQNDVGVRVVGDESTSANNPLPTVIGNNIYANSDSNFYTEGFINPASVVLNATGNWWQLTDPVAIRATIYTADATSPAVNIGTPLAAATIPLALYLSEVATTIRQVQPLNAGAAAQGVFTISRGGTVKTQIRRQTDYALIHESEQSFPVAGQHTFSWNGRDASGQIAAPGMYRAVITASDGRDWMRADDRADAITRTVSGEAETVYRPYKNEMYKAAVDLWEPGLVSIRVDPVGGASFYSAQDVYYSEGSHWLYWDGRDPSGNVVDTDVLVFMTDSLEVPINAIQVLSAKPTITGVLPAPDIEVKSDPYLVVLSYEQITRMAYRLSADSFVRFVLLPPGQNDIRGPNAIVLLDNVLQPAEEVGGAPRNHVVEWRGYDPDRPSQIRVAPEGAYTFAIEARSAVTSQSTLYRGVVNLRQ